MYISQHNAVSLNSKLQIPVCTPGPTASARSQWAIPGRNKNLTTAVGTTGRHHQAPDPSGHYRTSASATTAASSRSQLWAQARLDARASVRTSCQSACCLDFVRLICQYMCLAFFQIASQGGDHLKWNMNNLLACLSGQFIAVECV